MSNPFNSGQAGGGLDRITPSPNAQRQPQPNGAGPSLRSLDEAVNKMGAPALFTKHSRINDSGGGEIIDATVRQSRDFRTQEPEWWDDGNPKEQIVIRVKTDLRDPTKPNDDGTRGVYVKTWGPQLQALRDAIAAAGYSTASEALAPGNSFYAQLVGEQPSPVKDGDPEKLYAYAIQSGAPTSTGAANGAQGATQSPGPASAAQAEPPF